MLAVRRHEMPEAKEKLLRKAVRYEWITIGFMLSIIGVMYFTLGSSQSMKTAWIEDILSLVAPVAFLISARVVRRPPNKQYPYGYHRAVSIAFICGSVALFVMGLSLLYDGVKALAMREHPSIGAVEIFGRDIWLGWLMFAALAYSALPPFILGRIKVKLAEQIHDKTLHADASMNRADWLTALAAGLGVLGIGLGWWWADALAATFISFDITRDGYRNVKAAVTDLMNRHPQTISHQKDEELPERLAALLSALPWVEDAAVRLREEGHVFDGEAFVVPRPGTQLVEALEEARTQACAQDWRMRELIIMPVPKIERPEHGDGTK